MSPVNVVELYVFDVNQRSLGLSAAGANLSAGSIYGTNYASFGGDNLADPIANAASQQVRVAVKTRHMGESGGHTQKPSCRAPAAD